MPAEPQYTILSDITVPSARIRDGGALEHHLVIQDSDGNLYTVVISDRVYTPALAAAMAAQQRRLLEISRLREILGRES